MTNSFAQWYKKAADQGVPDAEYAIAACFADGDGVAQNNVEAFKYFSLAEAHGNTNAVIIKNALFKKMTPEQKAQAQQILESISTPKPKSPADKPKRIG